MSTQSHIEALQTRHATLENQIAGENSRPRPDNGALARMKVQKLRLKEEMLRLQDRRQ